METPSFPRPGHDLETPSFHRLGHHRFQSWCDMETPSFLTLGRRGATWNPQVSPCLSVGARLGNPKCPHAWTPPVSVGARQGNPKFPHTWAPGHDLETSKKFASGGNPKFYLFIYFFKPQNLGARRKPQTFGATWKPQNLGAGRKPQILGSRRKPQILGTTWKPQNLGAGWKPQILGARRKPQILGTTWKPQIFGATWKPQNLGAGWNRQIFCVTWKPQILGAGWKPQIFGVTWKPHILGAGQKPQIFGATWKPQILGTGRKPRISGAGAWHGDPEFRVPRHDMETPVFPSFNAFFVVAWKPQISYPQTIKNCHLEEEAEARDGCPDFVCDKEQRSESRRPRDESQWIVATRPLCHLQYTVTYLSHLQRILLDDRLELNFKAALTEMLHGHGLQMTRAPRGDKVTPLLRVEIQSKSDMHYF